MRVAVCHGSFADGDAIGRDMSGMCEALRRVGATPVILCQHASAGMHDKTVLRLAPGARIPDGFDLLIYHHSIYWEAGTTLLEQVRCPVIFKYHNITPPHFFASFAAAYAALCEQGIEQTRSMIRMFPRTLWLADSEFNRNDLVAMGLDPAQCRVVPPFCRLGELLRAPRTADYAMRPRYGLFVGRLAPSKGHRLLLDLLSCYVKHMSEDFVLRVVGGSDPALASYERLIHAQISADGLQGHVRMLGKVNDRELKSLYAASHVYLHFSEHEGFCVPLIEAQAVGLPVVCARSGATAETLGPQQLIGPIPQSGDDFVFYARLMDEVLNNALLRQHLIEQGLRNASERFLREIVECRFDEAIADQLVESCASPL